MAAYQVKHYYTSQIHKKANCYGGSISPAELAKLKEELAEVKAQAEASSAASEQSATKVTELTAKVEELTTQVESLTATVEELTTWKAEIEQLVNSLMDIKDFAGKTTFRAFAPNQKEQNNANST